jgi:mRNA-degrading endonuclease toxin of MazEF toxin-antitoxin module
MYLKLFDSWNKNKKYIDQLNQNILFHEGEIWWIQLGINVGIEQNGKGDNFSRPVLILKKYNRSHCLVVPLTTKKPLKQFSFHLDSSLGFLKKESWIVFSQIRVIDSKRFFERMGRLPNFVFERIKKEAREKILPLPSSTSPAPEEAGSSA